MGVRCYTPVSSLSSGRRGCILRTTTSFAVSTMAPKKPKQTPAWVATTAATAKVKVKLKSGDLKGIKKLFVDMIGKQVVDEWISKARDCGNAYAHGDAVPATVGTHAEHVHSVVPSHPAFGGHCHDVHNRHLWLRAPDKPHERLADRVPDPNGARLPALSNVVVH